MGIKFERIPAPVWVGPLIPIAAILVTFILTATLVVLVKANPLEAYYYFLIDPLSLIASCNMFIARRCRATGLST